MLKVDLDKASANQLRELSVKMPEKLTKAITIALTRAGHEMRDQAIDLAPYKTGNLRRSITVEVRAKEVEVGTNLAYGRIQDQGGVIPAHTVTPRAKKALAFYMGGVPVVVRSVRIPAVRINPYKGRGYLTPAFETQKNGRAQKIFDEEIGSVAK